MGQSASEARRYKDVSSVERAKWRAVPPSELRHYGRGPGAAPLAGARGQSPWIFFLQIKGSQNVSEHVRDMGRNVKLHAFLQLLELFFFINS